MGNCIRHDSEANWGGEDWTPALMTDVEKVDMKMEEERKGESKIKEVKLKITKKQLEELIGKMNYNNFEHKQEGFSADKVLGQLMQISFHCETHHHRSWIPRLQTIPEV